MCRIVDHREQSGLKYNVDDRWPLCSRKGGDLPSRAVGGPLPSNQGKPSRSHCHCGIVFGQTLSVEDEPTMTQIGKLGSVSFGSWWCGAGNDPRTSPL